MKCFELKISSPEGDLFTGEVVKLSLRASGGDLAVMAGHIPFVSYVKPCECCLELPSGEEKRAHIEGGVLTVGKERTILLTGDMKFE
ncbi:MAG: F0F1 ATP synthase subunit epsilon [Clostridia bacterium]|nr:F0F1 ATP synthase subunit epsilon [Clostridia bacterium]